MTYLLFILYSSFKVKVGVKSGMKWSMHGTGGAGIRTCTNVDNVEHASIMQESRDRDLQEEVSYQLVKKVSCCFQSLASAVHLNFIPPRNRFRGSQ